MTLQQLQALAETDTQNMLQVYLVHEGLDSNITIWRRSDSFTGLIRGANYDRYGFVIDSVVAHISQRRRVPLTATIIREITRSRCIVRDQLSRSICRYAHGFRVRFLRLSARRARRASWPTGRADGSLRHGTIGARPFNSVRPFIGELYVNAVSCGVARMHWPYRECLTEAKTLYPAFDRCRRDEDGLGGAGCQ